MTQPDDDYRGPRWLSPGETKRIWDDLLSGPKPRPVDPDLKASLLADVGPEEAEFITGLLEVIEQGSAPIEDTLAELDRMANGEEPGPPK